MKTNSLSDSLHKKNFSYYKLSKNRAHINMSKNTLVTNIVLQTTYSTQIVHDTPRLKTLPPLPQQSSKEEALRNQSVRIVPPQRGRIRYIVLLKKEKNKQKTPINILRCYFLVRNYDWTHIYAFMYIHMCTHKNASTYTSKSCRPINFLF